VFETELERFTPITVLKKLNGDVHERYAMLEYLNMLD